MGKVGWRRGFTLIEILVSVALLSLVMLALYAALDTQRSTNQGLMKYLNASLTYDRAAMVLYRDILASDGNLTITKGDFGRLCIHNSANSLYGLSQAKVCWVVAKEDDTLVRIEGGEFRLPLGPDAGVAVDRVFKNMKFFDVYRNKGEVLVTFQAASQKPTAFMLQGIFQPQATKPPQKKDINLTKQ